MSTRWPRLMALCGVLQLAAFGQPARADLIKCTLHFSLEGWSMFYESATGAGTIRCDNGQSAHVSLHAKGGGLTAGRSTIENGHGVFSPVARIDELFGVYATAEAHAGAGESSGARVVTKGDVSLALSGQGTGVDLGFSFGKFVIEEEGVHSEPVD
jgi:hypothetical protein